MVVAKPSPVCETTRKRIGPSRRRGAWANPVEASSFWKSARPPNTRLPRRNTAKVRITQPNRAPMTLLTTSEEADRPGGDEHRRPQQSGDQGYHHQGVSHRRAVEIELGVDRSIEAGGSRRLSEHGADRIGASRQARLAAQSRLNFTPTTEWSAPFSRMSLALSLVGAMFSDRFRPLMSRQMRSAVAFASSSPRLLQWWK